MNSTRLAESFGTAVAGATLGALAGAPLKISLPLAIVAGANGAISGWRGTYQWRSARGVTAFVLDSTWAGCTTLAGAVVNVAGLSNSKSGYHEGLSRRHNRHVYAKGVQLRRGSATTFGNVITGAGDLTNQRRAKLVTDHEDVHAWQARWFGPAYPVVYGSWWLGGALVGTAAWATVMRDRGLRPLVDSFGYYLNPFEWWAYSRDDHWPPSGLVAGLGWKSPAVQPFSATRAR